VDSSCFEDDNLIERDIAAVVYDETLWYKTERLEAVPRTTKGDTIPQLPKFLLGVMAEEP